MEPLRELAKGLVILGVVLVAVGALLFFAGRPDALPFRIGRLPGDIVYRGKHGTFYFPLMTSIALSVVLTLVFWLLNLFRR
jgi:Protein of unknown function (DUF2905)